MAVPLWVVRRSEGLSKCTQLTEQSKLGDALFGLLRLDVPPAVRHGVSDGHDRSPWGVLLGEMIPVVGRGPVIAVNDAVGASRLGGDQNQDLVGRGGVIADEFRD